MIVFGIIFIIVGIIAFHYSIKIDNSASILLFIIFIMSVFFAVLFITDGINNLNYKEKEKEIKNVKYYNIKSTVIIEDNIPTDTIYTIYYKKK